MPVVLTLAMAADLRVWHSRSPHLPSPWHDPSFHPLPSSSEPSRGRGWQEVEQVGETRVRGKVPDASYLNTLEKTLECESSSDDITC